MREINRFGGMIECVERSLLPLSNEGIIQLRKKSGIYLMPDGRINIASVREDQIDYITSEICSLKEFQSRRV